MKRTTDNNNDDNDGKYDLEDDPKTIFELNINLTYCKIQILDRCNATVLRHYQLKP